MRVFKAATAATLSALLFAIAGCGGSGNDSGGGSGGASAGAKDAKSLTIGFAQRTSDAPYYVAMQKEVERLSKEKGFKLLFQDGAGDPVKQIDAVQTMIAKGVDVFIINAVSPGTEKAQIGAVAKQKPVLFIDTPIPEVGFTTVQSDNITIGQEAGKLMAQRVGKGKTINLAVLHGPPTDVEVGPARRKGFLEGLKAGGVNYKIVAEADAAYTQDQAVPRTEDMLAAHSEIDAVFGYNDSMALGALSVLKNKKNTKVLVSGIDGQKEGLAAIKEGGCAGQYVSTGLNSPALAARDSVEIAIQVGTGAKKPGDFPKVKYTKAAGIDCNNIDEYYDPSSTF
jgi:ABC-type sugar transport system substrate-binding protein